MRRADGTRRRQLREVGRCRRGAVWLAAGALLLGCGAADAPASDAPDATAPDPSPPRFPALGEAPTDPEPGAADPDGSDDGAAQQLPPPPSSRAALEADLAALIDDADGRASGLSWGVLVTDEFGREVVSLEPDTPQLPASTMKQVTAAAILTTLGPDARLVTRVDATAGIGADGVLDGDLVLRGGGDPTLSTEAYGRSVFPARPRSSLEDLADQLVEQGLTAVTGAIHVTAPGFAGEPLPSGWPDRYLSAFDGRYIAGLTVDAGLRTLETYPQAQLRVPTASDEADDEAEDAVDGDEPEGPDADALAAFADAVGLDEVPGSIADLDVDAIDLGEVDPAVLVTLDPGIVDLGPPDVRVELATDPARQTADELRRALSQRGVEVAGEVTTGEPRRPVLARLATVESSSVMDLLRFTVQRSDNHLADTLFQVAGRTRTGTGSWPQGERALRQVLERFGIDPTGSVFADGSGLSRDGRLTARQLVDLDRALTSSRRWSAVWRDLQAELGVSGTLERRLRGTVAEGRFLGKTGTLRDVTALTGQVVVERDAADQPAPDERRYHLAVLATDTDVTGRAVARAVTDELILTLVADLDGCRVRIPDEGDGPLGREPRTVAC